MDLVISRPSGHTLTHNLTDGDSIQAAGHYDYGHKIKQAAIAFEIERQPVH